MAGERLPVVVGGLSWVDLGCDYWLICLSFGCLIQLVSEGRVFGLSLREK